MKKQRNRREEISKYKSPARRILAICPTCGKKHKTYMFWSGNGIPRIFCTTCQTPSDDRYAFITIHDSRVRKKIRKMFSDWDRIIEEREITRYSSEQYSQEELRALVEECRR